MNPLRSDAEAIRVSKSSTGHLFSSLDAWRGVACLGVVFFHIRSELFARAEEVSEHLFYRIAGMGYLGVQIFFVISGYCIVGAMTKAETRPAACRHFMRARIRRIMPTYLASISFIAVFKIFAELAARNSGSPSTEMVTVRILDSKALFFLANLTLSQLVFKQQFISRVAWSLCYEAAFYLVVGATLLFDWRKFSSLRRIELLHVITFGILGWLIINPNSVPYPLDLWPQFGFGIVVFDVLTRGRNRWYFLGFTILLTACFVSIRDVALGPVDSHSRITFSVSLCFALVLLLTFRIDSTLTRAAPVSILGKVGITSYSLYLVHYLVITLAFRLLGSIIHVRLSPCAHFLVITPACLLASLAFFRYFERPFISSVRQPVQPSAPIASGK